MVPSQNGTDLYFVILGLGYKNDGVSHHLFRWGTVKIGESGYKKNNISF